MAKSFTDIQQLPGQPKPGEFPFAFRLVHTTLQMAHNALAGSPLMPPDTARRIFLYSLRHHSRAELLFNIRWFLGPGYLEMYRLGNVSYATSSFASVFQDARHNIGDLNLAVDVDAVQDLVIRTHSLTLVDPFLNANDVELYLRGKGIKHPDSGDIAAVRGDGAASLTSNSTPRSAEVPVLLASANLQHHLFNFDAFFPDTEPTVVISQNLLLKNLTDISVCLASDPGYPRGLHDQAIAASVIRPPIQT